MTPSTTCSTSSLPEAPNTCLSGQRSGGFTLVEMSVVLVIIGLILGSILGPMSSQRENQRLQNSKNLLEEVRNALLGFAALNGFLPCPATAASNGLEARVAGAGSNCSQEHGFVPAVTLGMYGQFNATSQIIDEWGNPLRYSLSNVGTWAYAKDIRLTSPAPAYSVCSAAGCGAGTVLAANVLAVVFSQGTDGGTAPTSADQLENTDNDTAFVSRIPSEGGATQFDDVMIWLSPNLLTLHLVKSGRLGGG